MSFDGCDDVAEVWEQRKRRARKDHKCRACGIKIRRGDLYVYHFSLFEGQVDTVKRCLACDAIYEHLCSITDFENQPMPALNCGHEYKEVHGREPPPEIARLAFMTPAEMQTELAKGTT
jgi:hypothetical protein